MKKQWSASELATAVSGVVVSDNRRGITGFAIDNRKVVAGDIFVAIRGENHDGHKFALAAIKAGAVALLVSEEIEGLDLTAVSVIKVADTIEAMQKAANYYRKSLKTTRFIAVTGSNGKTTTRAMIYHMLSQQHKCCTTSGNLNNHIGMPLTILAVETDSDYAIIEMGMNHRGEISQLCNICLPDAALINSIGPAHIGILGSMENIAYAKAEIFTTLDSPNKTGVYPTNTEFTHIFKGAVQNCNAVSFGETADCDFKISNIITSENAVCFDITNKKKTLVCKLNLPAKHNAINAAAALALCASLEPENFELFANALASYKPVEARMERIIKDKITILLDCYNANPSSMQAALEYLSSCNSKNKIAVIGDMRELGDMSEYYHKELGVQIAGANLDLTLCLGEEIKHTINEAVSTGISPKRIIRLNSDTELADLLRDKLHEDSIVLFKASRGMHLEKVVQKLWPELGKNLH